MHGGRPDGDMADPMVSGMGERIWEQNKNGKEVTRCLVRKS